MSNVHASIMHRLYGSSTIDGSFVKSLLSVTKSCLGCAIVLVTVMTLDVPKEGTEDCEGIGREMERVAERMGGTTKWPYNDSDCLDAAPRFRQEAKPFYSHFTRFCQFWTRRAERNGCSVKIILYHLFVCLRVF